MENSRGDPIIEPLFQDELDSQTIGVIVAVFAVILTIGNDNFFPNADA